MNPSSAAIVALIRSRNRLLGSNEVSVGNIIYCIHNSSSESYNNVVRTIIGIPLICALHIVGNWIEIFEAGGRGGKY